MKVQVTFVLIAVFIQQTAFGAYDYISEFTNIVNRVQLETDITYTLSKVPVADQCTVFMDKSEFHGPLGQAIVETMTEDPMSYKYLLEGGTLNKYCRKYADMTAKQKASIWVLIMTLMAHFESSCKIKSPAKGPNGTAYGFFQLHKGKEQNYGGDACPKNSSMNAKSSTKCALSMLEYQMEKTGGDLFNKSSYWDVLRPRGQSRKAHQISRALTQFSVCNPKML